MKYSMKILMTITLVVGLCSCDTMFNNEKVDSKPMVSSWMAAGTTGI